MQRDEVLQWFLNFQNNPIRPFFLEMIYQVSGNFFFSLGSEHSFLPSYPVERC